MICEYCLANKTSTKIRTSRDGDGMYYLCDDCTPANLNAQLASMQPSFVGLSESGNVTVSENE